MNDSYQSLLEALSCGAVLVEKNQRYCAAFNSLAQEWLGDFRNTPVDAAICSNNPDFELEIAHKTLRFQRKDLDEHFELLTISDYTAVANAKKEIQQFAYLASHDLQEPLRKVTAFGDRLEKIQTEFSSEAKLYTSKMVGAGKRMSNMLDGLLQYSRVGNAPLEKDWLSLKTLLNKSWELLPFPSNSIFDITGHEVHMYTDAALLATVFQSIFDNAIKFTSSHQSLHVIATISTDQDQVILQIKDNGIGFDPKFNEHIFQMFTRLNGRSQYDGSGIGLAVARKIVSLLDGTITANATIGEGTTITIVLPLHTTVKP